MSCYPARTALRQSHHRKLREIDLLHRSVEQRQCRGIDQILGIMQNDHAQGDASLRFFPHEGMVELVQAIGLAGRTIRSMKHEPQPRVSVSSETDLIGGFQIIGITAHEESHFALRPNPQHVSHGCADHAVLAPGRNEHGARPMECVRHQTCVINTGCSGAPGQAQPDIRHVDRDLV